MVILAFQLYEKIQGDKKRELAVILFAINYLINVLQWETVPAEFNLFFKLDGQISFKNEEVEFYLIDKRV